MKIVLPLTIAAVLGTATTTADAGPRGDGIRSVARIFQAADVNNDGVISVDEFVDARLTRADRRFDRRDANGDGLITADEMPERPEPGENADEIRACVEDALGIDFPDRPEEGERFDAVDLNGDGAIDELEWQSAATDSALEAFDRMDSNLDGGLTPEEVGAALGRAAERRMALRECRQAVEDAADILG